MIVATCRVAAFDRDLEGFQICEVDQFDEHDVSLFVTQWFDDDSTGARNFLSDVAASHLAKDLSKTPLLLTLLCVLYSYRRTIPTNRAELYEACVDALLFKWDTYRSVDREPLLPMPIGPERKKQLLARVADRTFDDELIYIRESALVAMVESELSAMYMENVSALQLVKELESHNGLFVEYMPAVYCFSHLTFHEFFVALYYCETNDVRKLVDLALTNERYVEVFLMCMEKLYTADPHVMHVISHVRNECLSVEKFDEYLAFLVDALRYSSANMNPKLRLVLSEISARLEVMSIELEEYAGDEEGTTDEKLEREEVGGTVPLDVWMRRNN
jgi:predicted NACHT family NTPase